ncbi:MAG TPA: hydantoinase/oxoprolinase family protein [Solirubrobacteraceae bacterium]|jgi:N-methylhydantoinase A
MSTLIGVDVGGTHTDVAVLREGRSVRGKAPTRYDRFAQGVLDAIAVAAGELDLTREQLLAETELIVNSTTVVTNAITELRGANVGVLVTAGYRDTFRLGGGPRLNVYDDHLQVNMPDLLARESIVEIEERIDASGNVLVALDEAQVAAAVTRLVQERHVSAIAICFLSSYVNPAHERAAEQVIGRLYPELFTSPSHALLSSRGENRRWTTAVLNAFVHESAMAYVRSVAGELRDAGLKGGIAFFQGLGGAIGQQRALRYPLALLGSGPAGGALGACEVGRQRGAQRLLLGDMGGTSFDTGIVIDGEVPIGKHIEIGPFKTGVELVDIVSVGAGGGSIASIGERGTPQVGPRSARSTPGPAAYGRGGVEPTVTDAMIAMGFIDPDRYLGGRQTLDVDAARRALSERFAAPLQWSVEDGAAAIHDLAVVNMALAVREVTIERGHDPREFTFLAFGGTLPMFAGQIAAELEMRSVIIPRNSSVFCAQGLLLADFVVRREQTVDWPLADEDALPRVRATAEELRQRTVAELQEEGLGQREVRVAQSASLRFAGQTYELTLPLPDRPLQQGDGELLAQRFRETYERVYGAGTAWADAEIRMRDLTVTASARAADATALATPTIPPTEPARAERRAVYLPALRQWHTIDVHRDAALPIGAMLEGPCIVDAVDTTIFVPLGWRAERDARLDYVLTLEER